MSIEFCLLASLRIKVLMTWIAFQSHSFAITFVLPFPLCDVGIRSVKMCYLGPKC